MVTPIKSVVNKNENNYYCNIFLEKGLYKDKSKKQYLYVFEGIGVNKTSASKSLIFVTISIF